MQYMRFIFILVVILAISIANASPKGGGRGGSSSGGRGSSFGGSSFGGKGSSLKRTFVKGAVIGAGAYVGYKAVKLAGKFAANSIGLGGGFDFDNWNNWREADGMLCRTSRDCSWISPDMYCQDYEVRLNTQLINQNWFGGNLLSIQGECACPLGTFFDPQNDFQCRQNQGLAL